MARKKSRKKATKKKVKKLGFKVVQLDALLEEVSDAERELKRIRTRLIALCRRVHVVKR